MNEEYRQALEKITRAYGSIGDEITKIVKVALSKTLPKINELFDEIPEFTEDRKQYFEKFCEKLLELGWVLSDFLPLNVQNINFSSKKDADEYMWKFYQKETLDVIFDTLLKNNIPEQDVDNIRKTFEAEAYKACCMFIMSVLEHYILSEYNITDNPMLKLKAIKELKVKNEEKNSNKIAAFIYLHNHSLWIGLQEVFREVDLKSVDDSSFPVPSRHCLHHGYSKRNFTEKDCWFLLLLLFGFIEQKETF